MPVLENSWMLLAAPHVLIKYFYCKVGWHLSPKSGCYVLLKIITLCLKTQITYNYCLLGTF